MDLEDAIWKLEQERMRNDNLMQLNRELRNELEETRKLNGALTSGKSRFKICKVCLINLV